MTLVLSRSARLRRFGRLVTVGFCVLGSGFGAAPAKAQTVVPGSRHSAHVPPTAGEIRATRAFEAAKRLGAPELYAFLKPMPKGADLHMHLSGAVYAETFIAEAARQGLCVAPVSHGTPPVPEGEDVVRFVAPEHGEANDCGAGEVPVAKALDEQPLYDDLIDSFSMRAFVPSEGVDGHDQFFATFARFGGLKGDAGEWLDEVASRAARQNEQYLEVMQTPEFSRAEALGYRIGWPANAKESITDAQLAELRAKLLDGGLRNEVRVDEQEFAAAQAGRTALERCGADEGRSLASPPSGCAVKVRWIYQVLRGFPPEQVFAQTVLGFEVASADPQVVGINFVMAEDGRVSMRDYHLQMQMVGYLHSVYPKVHITLHAGELAPGLVPPVGLTFHIRQAVEIAHAERIGHGMDVLYETRPEELLREMAARHIMVEVNLTSNDVILGQRQTDHPLAAYRAAHVPWALATDDEGVSRIDLTHEYVKGAEEQNLSYADLKQSARTSLEHSFLPGQSLWAEPDDFSARRASCAGPIGAASQPTAACAAFLRGSEKASEQWELERRFAVFEASVR